MLAYMLCKSVKIKIAVKRYHVKIVGTELGNNAGLMGAYHLATLHAGMKSKYDLELKV